jgi:short-subunit dehydrogenase
MATKIVVYDRVDLIHAGRRAELLQDLSERTGVKIDRIEIGKVDLLRDTAVIKVHFDVAEQPDHFEANGLTD